MKPAAWRVLAVFVSALIVDVSATNWLAAMSGVQFWQDVAGAAITAVLAELLELARPHAAQGPPGGPHSATDGPAAPGGATVPPQRHGPP